jgi:hypothetical protein
MSGLAVERIVGAVLFLAGASGCGIASSIALSDMIEDINRLSPAAEQENPAGWHFMKLRRVRRKYRTLYPDGNRVRTLTRLMIIGPVLAVVGARLMLGPNLFGF